MNSNSSHSQSSSNNSSRLTSNDKFHDECGVFGVYGHDDAAALTALGLHALQHRGQEACGIVSFDGEHFHSKKALGLVDGTFGDAAVINLLTGHAAIGHNRYSTTGESGIRNIQPLYADMDFGGFSIAHNGNLTNAMTLRADLVKRGAIFQSTSDTEVIIHLIAQSQKKTFAERFTEALKKIKGAYSFVALTGGGQVIGVRDPNGIRPLVLGRLGDSYILSSESCALDIIGADFVRDIEPGEMVVLNGKGVQSSYPLAKKPERFCIFEYIYFARPDSFMEGKSVYESRKAIGAELAREAPVKADLVVPVPDSGTPSAIGFAEESGIPFELGIIRNHYVGRTFIEPSDKIRHLGVKLKHNANRAYIKGKRVVLVDDSIVRGTTSKKIVEMVRNAGAEEVHMRISSPPTKYGCFYGIDTPRTEELLAHSMSVQQICDFIGADSLAYISHDGLYRAVGEARRNKKTPQYCDACFTGDYPAELTDNENKRSGDKVTDLRERRASKKS